MTESTARDDINGWAILELMGHRKLAGVLTDVSGGAMAGFIRLDIPGPGKDAPMVATQFYAPAAVYCITPTTEAMARAVAASCQPAPVQRWELPAAVPAADHVRADEEIGADEDGDEDEDDDPGDDVDDDDEVKL